MPAPNPSLLTWLVLLPLIAWRMVVRFRRLTQKQRFSRVRPWITLTVFPMLLWLLVMTAFVPPNPPQPWKLVPLAVGVAAGAALGVFGLKRTRFEAGPEGMFYTPDARLGIALSVLFVLRLAYRMGELALTGPRASEGLDFALSPYTLAPVGLFSGYYMAFAVGLLVWRWKVNRSGRAQRAGA